jgi:dTDP-4-amino-4,6-dideoxygalactose transaminase
LNKNFLPSQYKRDEEFRIQHNYLYDQFADRKEILEKIEGVVRRGDFTLGEEVDRFEEEFASLIGVKYAIGVGSGTDALFLSLRALNIQPGDEVITTAFTFYATVGAIVTAGATPVFCDIGDDFNLNIDLIESKITSKTKAIIPVHWSGRPCSMYKLMELSNSTGIPVIEDACHSILAEINGQKTGTFGLTGCFSFHPLKNLNVWGDGGIVTTNSEEINSKIRLLRNHGLSDRDTCEVFAYNSRLDTVQAVVAHHMLPKLSDLTNQRIQNAKFLDAALELLPQIRIPARVEGIKEVFHIYSFHAENRDRLQKHLNSKGIDAKVHYPKPIHLQPAAQKYGHKIGDFPKSESAAHDTLSLPVHEFISESDLDFMVSEIKAFYA